MNLSREDINIFYHQVHQIVAKRLEVDNFELKSTSELVGEIENSYPIIFSKVKKFINAYEFWFKVHQAIDAAGSSGNLSTQENNELMIAISDRDQTRKELISELEKQAKTFHPNALRL